MYWLNSQSIKRERETERGCVEARYSWKRKKKETAEFVDGGGGDVEDDDDDDDANEEKISTPSNGRVALGCFKYKHWDALDIFQYWRPATETSKPVSKVWKDQNNILY